VDIILAYPACAGFIARRLVDYFAGEHRSGALVDAVAKRWRDTHGDIAAALDTLFNAPDFVAEPGRRFKDPYRFVVSAVRLAYDGQPVADPARLVAWVQRMGYSQFDRITPDGYPLADAAWVGSGALSIRFDAARSLAMAANRAMTATGSPVLTASPLYEQTLLPRLSARTRVVLHRTRSESEAAVFALASPEFNRF